MKKRKLKAFVLPMLYIMIIGAIFVSVGFMSKSLEAKPDSPSYAVDSIIKEVTPVLEEASQEIIPAAPYKGEEVVINKDYYSKDDNEQVQQNSLIKYDNTYMQNTGILYTSPNPFNVTAVLDGTVESIKDNEFLGKVVEIKHNNNLSTFYYSLTEVTVKEKDNLKAGDIIGTSGTNKITPETSALLFEVYYKGKAIDPDIFYQTDVNKYS